MIQNLNENEHSHEELPYPQNTKTECVFGIEEENGKTPFESFCINVT